MRLVITGSPQAGKTELSVTLARELGVIARHTDETIPLGWSPASAEVAKWFEAEGPWVIEGVAVPRALRKFLAAHPDRSETPCDTIILCETPVVELTKGQETMRKGVASVWAEVWPELEARGVVLR